MNRYPPRGPAEPLGRFGSRLSSALRKAERDAKPNEPPAAVIERDARAIVRWCHRNPTAPAPSVLAAVEVHWGAMAPRVLSTALHMTQRSHAVMCTLREAVELGRAACRHARWIQRGPTPWDPTLENTCCNCGALL